MAGCGPAARANACRGLKMRKNKRAQLEPLSGQPRTTGKRHGTAAVQTSKVQDSTSREAPKSKLPNKESVRLGLSCHFLEFLSKFALSDGACAHIAAFRRRSVSYILLVIMAVPLSFGAGAAEKSQLVY